MVDNWGWLELDINSAQSLGLTQEEFEDKKPNLLIKLGEIVAPDQTICAHTFIDIMITIMSKKDGRVRIIL